MEWVMRPWGLEAGGRRFGRWFDERRLVEFARRKAGALFGQTDFLEGTGTFTALAKLAEALGKEADLSLFGRLAVRWDVDRFITNLARFAKEEQDDPEICAEPIGAPIFITGLPRAGTSFLHRLLTEDELTLVPRCWQTIYPYPLTSRGRRSDQDEVRRRRVDRQLAFFRRLAPEMQDHHPFWANSPQECTEITAHLFQSLRFDTTFHIPSYRHWLDQEGHVEAYRFHKRFLQHLQRQMVPPGRRERRDTPFRWILKCPDHVFVLDAIREVYPDARFVFVHRDPLKMLGSVARLTEILRRPFTRHIDQGQIGRQVGDHWADGAARMVEACRSRSIAPDRIFHVHYTELTADPLGTLDALYRHFGLDLPGEVRLAMARRIAAAPRGGYGEHVYRIEDYHLDPENERKRYKDYLAYFAVDEEEGARQPAARHAAAT